MNSPGADPAGLFEQSYFDVYLRYWEQYHLNLALTGLKRDWKIVVYGEERMMGVAREYFRRFRSRSEARAVQGVSTSATSIQEWRASRKARSRRVTETWKVVGLRFRRRNHAGW
jgi:hypothetical protein